MNISIELSSGLQMTWHPEWTWLEYVPVLCHVSIEVMIQCKLLSNHLFFTAPEIPWCGVSEIFKSRCFVWTVIQSVTSSTETPRICISEGRYSTAVHGKREDRLDTIFAGHVCNSSCDRNAIKSYSAESWHGETSDSFTWISRLAVSRNRGYSNAANLITEARKKRHRPVIHHHEVIIGHYFAIH